MRRRLTWGAAVRVYQLKNRKKRQGGKGRRAERITLLRGEGDVGMQWIGLTDAEREMRGEKRKSVEETLRDSQLKKEGANMRKVTCGEIENGGGGR